MPPCLQVCSASQFLHIAYLLISTLTERLWSSVLHAFTLIRLQRTFQGSRVPHFYNSMPYGCSASPELQRFIPLQLHTCSVCSLPPELRSSIPLRVHICTPVARLRTSISLRLQIYAPAARLYTPMPPRLYLHRVPLSLQISMPLRLHVYTPSARL